ncbi:MAG: prepilin-type N-terminal cleavage/methylation domain-containing protein [Planctomycetota bacterium]|nr:prepilin-type N-terminal cleavage/methylation domain-containing protein [Planctomycetota bacterium]
MERLNSRPHCAPAARPGFTLIELLVVVSIIALLIGILLPTLGQARESAKDAICLSNVKYLAACNYNYAVDNTVFIGFSAGNDRKKALLPYAGAGENNADAGKSVWNCPGNKRLTNVATGAALEASYGFNTTTNWQKIERVNKPGETVLLGDGGINDRGDAIASTHLMSPQYVFSTGLARPNPRHHGGEGFNVGWADGHGAYAKIAPPIYPALPDYALGVGVSPSWRPTSVAGVITDVNDPAYLDTLWDLK